MKKTKNDNLNENTKETSKDVIDETCRESIAMDEKEKLNEKKQENFEKGDSDGSSLDSDQKSADTDMENGGEDENTKYMRLMADFQNYKKRVEKQRSETFAFANEKIMLKLLDVLDNFERGLEADHENESFKEGMEMILKQLKDVLLDNGLMEIEAENVEFDPNIHNAVLMEDTDFVESGKVSGVLQKGYSLNGKVIRPAMVKVAK